jgi:hypothetical protein
MLIIATEILSGLFMPFLRQSNALMAVPFPDASLQVIFGKAFLLHLHRGDLETAKVFARAFLIRTSPTTKCGLTVSAAA